MPGKPFAPTPRLDHKPRMKQVNLRINHEETELLTAIAAARGCTVSELIRSCISKALNRQTAKPSEPKKSAKPAKKGDLA